MDEARLQDAIANPQNLGEMADADAVGTVGSPDCGDMVRMWIKYRELDGRKVIDKATFQSFGCQTAIAVASMATELIRGKTREEAMQLSGEELSKPLGPLPPMKIHCGQMVEGALKAALDAESGERRAEGGEMGGRRGERIEGRAEQRTANAPTLAESLSASGKKEGKIKIILQS